MPLGDATAEQWWAVVAGAGERLYIVEIGVGVAVAPTTAPSFFLARSTAIGTVTTTLAGQPHDPADAAAVGTFDSVFSVQPTFSTALKLRQGGLSTTAGGLLIWTFYDDPLVITNATTSGLVAVAVIATSAVQSVPGAGATNSGISSTTVMTGALPGTFGGVAGAGGVTRTFVKVA